MKKKLTDILYSFSLLLFIIAFNFQHNPPSGWYQQFMPDLGSLSLRDITFVDSLTGYAIAGTGSPGDTNRILKTINSGDNWSIIHSVYRDLSSIQFLDINTGYICGGLNFASSYFAKTTDGGFTWQPITQAGFAIRFSDMAVVNEDTVWLVDYISINSGIYRTTNGGINWQVQFGGTPGGNKPDKIYMYDGKFGFAGSNNFLWRTIDSGLNWDIVPGEIGFRDIYFADSLTGWKAFGTLMKKSIDGGTSWISQPLPAGGIVTSPGISNLSVLNKDTLWGVGGNAQYPNLQNRGLIYRSTNGGGSWLYQIPDTSINIYSYRYIHFWNNFTGWAYSVSNTGIYTETGGDSVFYPITNIIQIGTEIPETFSLHQNFPNPFNPRTKIRYQLSVFSEVKLIVYDLIGRKISMLFEGKQAAGTYEYTFDGSGLTSGVYLYKLEVISNNEIFSETKKMLMIK